MNFVRVLYLMISCLIGYATYIAYHNKHYYHAAFFFIGVLDALILALISRTKKTTVQDK